MPVSEMVGTPEPEPGQRTAQDLPLPGGSFPLFVQKLAYQALMSLGTIENPVSGERSTNLPQARMVIDDLRMLREKTSGNLEEDEAAFLESVLAELEKRHTELAGEDAD